MEKMHPNRVTVLSLISGLAIFALVMLFTTGIALAAPQLQEDTTSAIDEVAKECGECHLDISSMWSYSPHANAYADPYFQERWIGLGSPSECLACHTTNYIASTGEYSAAGVSCEACHGKVSENHPPEIVSIQADAEYCGKCHTTTLSEWKTTGHATLGIGCMQCHDPHSQQSLFENPDDLCINCHQEDMERYLEDTHVQKGIGCVDCHMLVIPPDPIPDDGIVPTGHGFTITPATCVACHTDALHAGFSLPGFERGAAAYTHANGITETLQISEQLVPEEIEEQAPTLSLEQQIQVLETALASRNITTLFQGGVIGLVLGSSTAWLVARNVRRSPSPVQEETKDDEETEE